MQIEILALLPADTPVLIKEEDLLDLLVRSQALSPVLSLNTDQSCKRLRFQSLQYPEYITEALLYINLSQNGFKNKHLLSITLLIPPEILDLNNFNQIAAFHLMGLEIKSQIRSAESSQVDHIDQLQNRDIYHLMAQQLRNYNVETEIVVHIILDETYQHFHNLGWARFEESRKKMVNYMRDHFRSKGYYPGNRSAEEVFKLDFLQLYHLIFKKSHALSDETFDEIIHQETLSQEDHEDLRLYCFTSNLNENFPDLNIDTLEELYNDLFEFYLKGSMKKGYSHLEFDQLKEQLDEINRILSLAKFPNGMVLK